MSTETGSKSRSGRSPRRLDPGSDLPPDESGRSAGKPQSRLASRRAGWFLGDQQFKQELLIQMHERRRDHYEPELREADQVHAERVLSEELSRRGWTEAELGRRRKGDPGKVALAGQLRARTTMTLKWIARRLNMGAWMHASNCLAQQRRNDREL